MYVICLRSFAVWKFKAGISLTFRVTHIVFYLLRICPYISSIGRSVCLNSVSENGNLSVLNIVSAIYLWLPVPLRKDLSRDIAYLCTPSILKVVFEVKNDLHEHFKIGFGIKN